MDASNPSEGQCELNVRMGSANLGRSFDRDIYKFGTWSTRVKRHSNTLILNEQIKQLTDDNNFAAGAIDFG
jgi:hypothetical protein